jgi:hypothetical protein
VSFPPQSSPVYANDGVRDQPRVEWLLPCRSHGGLQLHLTRRTATASHAENCDCISRGERGDAEERPLGRLRFSGRVPREAALRLWRCGGETSPRTLERLPLQFSAPPRPPRETAVAGLRPLHVGRTCSSAPCPPHLRAKSQQPARDEGSHRTCRRSSLRSRGSSTRSRTQTVQKSQIRVRNAPNTPVRIVGCVIPSSSGARKRKRGSRPTSSRYVGPKRCASRKPGIPVVSRSWPPR